MFNDPKLPGRFFQKKAELDKAMASDTVEIVKTASGYAHPELPGRFFKEESTLKLVLAKKKGGDGVSGMAKAVEDKEHPHSSCMQKVKKHDIDVDDPEAYCAAVVDKAKGTTHWRGKEKKKKKD